MKQAEFDKAYKRLRDEIIYLQSYWDEYAILFASGSEPVDLLNRVGNWFFMQVQRGMSREIILGICRLTEPPKKGRERRLTIDLLLQDPRLDSRPELREQIRSRIAALRTKAKAIRDHRHNYIAHLNLDVATKVVELPPLARRDMKEALEEMQAIYRLHGGEIEDAHYIFTIQPMKGAARVLDILAQGDAAESKKYNAHLRTKE